MNHDDIIVKVAALLGGEAQPVNEWYDPEKTGYRAIHIPGLHKWAGISMRFGQYGLRDKFAVGFHHNKDLRDYYLGTHSGVQGLPSEIKISTKKTPEQIAREIQRRLLPGYLEWLNAAQAIVEDVDQHTAARTGLSMKIIQFIADHGQTARTSRSEFSAYCYSKGERIETEVSYDGQVRLNLDVSEETAMKVLAVVLEAMKK